MSEFDQEDGRKKWFANPDLNPAQCNVVAAEHRQAAPSLRGIPAITIALVN